MNLLVLGKGKTGSLVAAVAEERGHQVRALGSAENMDARALTREALASVDVVVDFTTPKAVLANIAACAIAGTNMVVGTTGWNESLPRVRELVAQGGIGFLYAANFSVGVNMFFEVARTAAAALGRGYRGEIVECHHAQKKDKPSGTAARLQKIVEDASGVRLEITSLREGDVVGRHEVRLASSGDTMTLVHEAQSRRGYAEGAVLAAEWLAGRKGFFEFRNVLQS